MCEGLQHDRLVEIRNLLHTSLDEQRKQRLSIPSKVSERQYLASSTVITLNGQSRQLEEITCIIASCSSTGGVLTLGDRTWNMPIGTVVWNLGENGILLGETDTRTLVQTTAGPISLELLGIEKADKLGW